MTPSNVIVILCLLINMEWAMCYFWSHKIILILLLKTSLVQIVIRWLDCINWVFVRNILLLRIIISYGTVSKYHPSRLVFAHLIFSIISTACPTVIVRFSNWSAFFCNISRRLGSFDTLAMTNSTCAKVNILPYLSGIRSISLKTS